LSYQNTAKINALLFADNQVITSDLEDALQGTVFYIAKHHKILEWKYHQQTLAFLGRNPVRCKSQVLKTSKEL
jgi:hypothetical protein